MKVLIFLLVFFVVVSSLAKESTDPLVKTFKTLPPEDKNEFLAYFLAIGVVDYFEGQPRHPKYMPATFIKSLNISQENISKFEKMNIPKESRKKLLEWTKLEFSLTTREVIKLVKTNTCQGPKCISLPDVNEICCPW